jgi:hypothetical protein
VAGAAPRPGGRGHRRPDQVRLIPEADPHFRTLCELRNDAESLNRGYTRTLSAGRAATRGWRRQVLDLLSRGILTNTLAWHLHNEE